MASLNTRIVLRNDSTANWLASQSVVLLKGEVGIEFLESGKVKLKIGDGIKSWSELDYFGGESENIEAALAELERRIEIIADDLASQEEITGTLISRVETLETDAETVDARIDARINEFANQITDNGTIDTVKELFDYVAEHGDEFKGVIKDIDNLKEFVGDTPVAEQIETATGSLIISLNQTEEKLKAISELKKYVVLDTPAGTLVDYRDHEIRIMCPENAEFHKQSVGAGGDSNTYYMSFRTYVPNDAVAGYIEHIGTQSDAEILNTFSTDKNGRKYQVTWLGIAKYDEFTGSWNYYGKNSTKEKYIGWDYRIDWYDANNVKIASDSIRINLSNESCHNSLMPYYMGKVIQGIKLNNTLVNAVDGVAELNIPIVVTSEEENKISIAEDGTMEINSLNVNKLVQTEGEVLVLNGGAAAI